MYSRTPPPSSSVSSSHTTPTDPAAKALPNAVQSADPWIAWLTVFRSRLPARRRRSQPDLKPCEGGSVALGPPLRSKDERYWAASQARWTTLRRHRTPVPRQYHDIVHGFLTYINPCICRVGQYVAPTMPRMRCCLAANPTGSWGWYFDLLRSPHQPREMQCYSNPEKSLQRLRGWG